MRDFFKPWRRKVGIVTLGLACVFAAGWVRSMHIEDYFWVSLGPFGWGSSSSVDGSLHCTIKSQNLNILYAGWSSDSWSRPVIELGREAAYATPNDAWWIDKDGYVVTKSGVKIGGQVDGQYCWTEETPPQINLNLPALNTDCIDLCGNRTKSSRPPPDAQFDTVIPFWSIVLPLTLLSAWLLLLSKPRSIKKPEPSSPPELDHA